MFLMAGRKEREEGHLLLCENCVMGVCILPSIACKASPWQNELFFLPQHFLLLILRVLPPKEVWGWGDEKPQLYYQHRSFAVLCTQDFTPLENAVSLPVGFRTCSTVVVSLFRSLGKLIYLSGGAFCVLVGEQMP